MRRFLLASTILIGLLGTSQAAYNEPTPIGNITGFGAGVVTALKNATDAALGLVTYNALIADITALGGIPASAITLGTNWATALATTLDPTVEATLSVPTNGASGLEQLNASGFAPITPQIGVTAGATPATAGNIGEIISSDIPVGSATSLTSPTAKNITSIALTSGDWDCQGTFVSNPAGTTTTSLLSAGISASTGALPTALEFQAQYKVALAAGIGQTLIVPSQRISISTGATYFLVGQATFATSTMTGYGQISCRRAR
jgi:hypothetical protein